MKTVLSEFGDGRASRSGRSLKYLEFVFLFVGLVAIDYYIWVNARSTISQAYDHWSFTEQLQGRSATIVDFFKREIDALLGRGSRTPESAPSDIAERQPLPPPPPAAPKPLDVLGRLEIPRLQMDLMVREGVTDQALRSAVGHVPSTALPGQAGNVALAAHRDTFFRPLRNIRKGDVITVDTLHGSYRYAVKSIQIVWPSDTQVLNASNQPELTLITCYPFYYVGSAPRRFIVHAVQLGPALNDQSSVRAD
jgi:sortase A